MDGLSEKEVKELQKRYGKNIIKGKKRTIIDIIVSQFSNFILYLLLIGAGLSFYLGNNIDAIAILLAISLSVIFGSYLEYSADKSIESLNKLTKEKTIVIRDRKRKEIESEDIVPGDLIILEEGNRVPADAIIIDGNLEIDESMLTGESKTVLKKQGQEIFAGTTIKGGKAIAKIKAIGSKTEIGKLGKALEGIEKQKTNIQVMLEELGKKISLATIIFSIIFFIISIINERNIEETLLMSVALIVAAVPEGLITILTIILAFGIKEMAKHNAIVRKMHAVENIGNITAILTDKTGTLTNAKLSFDRYYDGKKEIKKIPEEIKKILYSTMQVEKTNKGWKGNETDVAIAEEIGYEKVGEIIEPFKSENKYVKSKINNNIYWKGAIEVFEVDEEFKKKAIEFAKKGRVIAIAKGETRKVIGLLLLKDKIRKGVKEAIKDVKEMGIELYMITGDSKYTAEAVAKELKFYKGAIEWRELENKSDKEIREILAKKNIIARITPFGKLKIVELLKPKYKIAVTGDGVNDSLALKKADVAIVMGSTGTEVSKEVADIILADDNFATIVKAIEYGKGIFENIKNFIRFQFTSNTGAIGAIILSFLFSLKEPLTAIQLLFINIIVDGPPALSLGFEKTKKIKKKENIMDKTLWYNVLFMGTYMALITILLNNLYGLTYSFLGLAIMQLFHSFNCRSIEKSFIYKFDNKIMIISFLTMLGILFVISQIGAIGKYFGIEEITIYEFLFIVGIASSVLIIEEIRKRLKIFVG